MSESGMEFSLRQEIIGLQNQFFESEKENEALREELGIAVKALIEIKTTCDALDKIEKAKK